MINLDKNVKECASIHLDLKERKRAATEMEGKPAESTVPEKRKGCGSYCVSNAAGRGR